MIERQSSRLFQDACVFALACLTAGCMATSGEYRGGSLPQARHLYVHGPLWDGPAEIRHVFEGSPAEGKVEIGDRVTAIGDHPVRSLAEYFDALVKTPGGSITLTAAKGQSKQVPFRALADPESYATHVLPVAAGESLVFGQEDVYGRIQESGYFVLPGMSGLIRASVWDTAPKYVEVFLEIRVDPKCNDCELKNVALLDASANSFLQPVQSVGVAHAVFPQLGQRAPTPMPVPAPTVTGYSGTAATMGTFSGYRTGNYVQGTYAGTTTGTMVPYYDYTATNMALGYNLGVAIQQNMIQTAHHGARQFVAQRTGNLHVGKLMPGERITGYVFFAVPATFEGPYLAYVLDGNDKMTMVAFEQTVERARYTHARQDR